MKTIRFAGLLALSACLAVVHAGAQTPPRDDFRDDFATGAPTTPAPATGPAMRPATPDGFGDFIPDAPLGPLDAFLRAPLGIAVGWDDDGPGDAAPPPPAITQDAPPTATDAPPAGGASPPPQAEATAGLPDGWVWHRIEVTTLREDIRQGVRLALPAGFAMLDPEDDIIGTVDPGDVAFTDTDLAAMARAVIDEGAAPHGTVINVGLSDEDLAADLAGDPDFTVLARDRIALPDGLALDGVSVRGTMGPVTIHMDAFTTERPVAGGLNLTLMVARFADTAEGRDLAARIAGSLALEAVTAAPDLSAPDGTGFLGGALVLDGAPDDGWRVFMQRPDSVSFTAPQGFIGFDIGARASVLSDPAMTFATPPAPSRGDLMGLAVRLFEAPLDEARFEVDGRMVGGRQYLALLDACLPGGVPVAVAWFGTEDFIAGGAFDRFFAAARLDAMAPCTRPAEGTALGPPAAAPAATAPPVPDTRDAATPVGTAAAPDDAEIDLQFEVMVWETVRDSDSVTALQAYLDQYPDGHFAVLATLRLAALSGTESADDDLGPGAAGPRDDCLRLSGAQPVAAGAIDACRAALAAHPGDAALHDALALALQAQGAMEEALAHFRAAAEGGHAPSMTALAVAYRLGDGVAQDDGMAVQWYRRAAAAGDAMAMNNLGFMHGRGLGGLRADPAEAARWYLRAAEAGSAQAMNNIGRTYRDGLGVPRDPAQALHWLRRGAEAGHPAAMNNLGGMLSEGDGVARDPTEALAWFRRAADLGDAAAVANIGLAYAHGHGVAVDPDQAADWLARAIREGAAEAVVGVADSLPRPTLAALQRRMASAGVYGGAIDGISGPQTRTAIRSLGGLGP